jgi:hypothetical protein
MPGAFLIKLVEACLFVKGNPPGREDIFFIIKTDA